MNHILEYEAMSPEGAGALPPMPDFLKQSGAKAEFVFAGGPPPKDKVKIPNAWTIEAKVSVKGIGDCTVIFYPTGAFRIYTSGLGISSNKGMWKAQSGSSFTIGRTEIKGVSMQFSTLFGIATFD